MTPIEKIMLAAAVLLLVAILASKASSRLGVPALLFFLLIGMLAGSDGPGGIWFDDQKPRTGWNVGFSWRFGPTRATRGNPVELAIGVRYGAGIQSGQHWAMTLRRSISF